MRIFVGVTFVFILIFGCATGPAPAERRQPNVILILADDLGYGDLGCFGQETLKTPRLDTMALQGMRFTQFYAGCTVCLTPAAPVSSLAWLCCSRSLPDPPGRPR